MTVLQDRPLLFGLPVRLLTIYLIQFAVFFFVPYLLSGFGIYYYTGVAILLVSVNIFYKKQMVTINSRITWYFSKKRIRN